MYEVESGKTNPFLHLSISEQCSIDQPLSIRQTARLTSTVYSDTPPATEPAHFNKATDDGRNMKMYATMLDQAIHSMINRQQEQEQEQEVDSLFSPGRTSALTQNLIGIEDFERISFLVIQAV